MSTFNSWEWIELCFMLFTFSDFAAFLELIQFLFNKGNDVLNWIIWCFYQMSALPPRHPDSGFSAEVSCSVHTAWLWNKNQGIMLQFNTTETEYFY